MKKTDDINIVFSVDNAIKLLPFLKKKQVVEFISNLEDYGFIKTLELSENDKSKLKPIKKSKFSAPSLEEFMKYALESLAKHPAKLNSEEIESFKFEVQNKYYTYASNGWRNGYNKPILNWSSTLRNQIKYLVKNAQTAFANKKEVSKYTSKEIYDLFVEDAQGKFKSEIQKIYIDYNFSQGAVFDLVNMFQSHLVTSDIIHINTSEYFKHFKNWLHRKEEFNSLTKYKKYKGL